jgi:hypothetical protein
MPFSLLRLPAGLSGGIPSNRGTISDAIRHEVELDAVVWIGSNAVRAGASGYFNDLSKLPAT